MDFGVNGVGGLGSVYVPVKARKAAGRVPSGRVSLRYAHLERSGGGRVTGANVRLPPYTLQSGIATRPLAVPDSLTPVSASALRKRLGGGEGGEEPSEEEMAQADELTRRASAGYVRTPEEKALTTRVFRSARYKAREAAKTAAREQATLARAAPTPAPAASSKWWWQRGSEESKPQAYGIAALAKDVLFPAAAGQRIADHWSGAKPSQYANEITPGLAKIFGHPG